MLLIIQMMKQAALWITILQLPVYIAQDQVGGLGWTHLDKGIILFLWVLFQNIAAVIFGAFSDKIGRKRSLLLSHFIMVIGYVIISFADNFSIFTLGTILLGIGSGIFKPILEGSIARELNTNNSSKGWSFYIIAINIGVIWSTLLIEPLRSNGWNYVFLGSSVILMLDIVFLFFIKDTKEKYHTSSALSNLKNAIRKKELWRLVIIMSGFTAIYMQFYEMLPNYFIDWTDSSNIASSLPDFFSYENQGKRYLSYEWIFWLNPILVVLTIIPLTDLLKYYQPTKSLQIGMALVVIGISFIAFTQNGWIVLLGVCVYTFGEMVLRPKYFEYVSSMATDKEKSLYMSFVNLSYAIGYLFSSISGGFLYDNLGEKAVLACKHTYQDISELAYQDIMNNFSYTYFEATQYLWNEYNPWIVWVPYIILGVLSFILLVKQVNK
ncbi:MFS transporter [Candidatus Kapabacteria bacterium]|nr:MFS transporter [Candidatus Kapabacteria bacterium]